MPSQRIVRPGQDALLADMLGQDATLPGACSFTGGRADGPVIVATYACPAGKVVVELRDAREASTPLARTESFAIGVRGPAPPDLLEALQSRILSREDAFVWEMPAHDGGIRQEPPEANGSAMLAGELNGIALLLLGAAGLLALWTAQRRFGVRSLLIALLGMTALALTAEVAYRAVLTLAVPRYTADTAFELYGVGESTMVGEPFEPKISIPRLLEHMFGSSIAGRPMVVVNLAERGVPLYPQSAALERALAARHTRAPGVVLIMSGHNEAFSPSAAPPRPYVPSILAERSALVRDALLALRRRRLIDRERSMAVYEHYLRRVIETAEANGLVPVVTTMASNIARIEPNADVSAAAIAGTIEEGRVLESQRRYAAARDLYLSRRTPEPSSAVLDYRAGRCEEALGNFDAAREHYWTAVDRDPRLLFGRATRLQNDLVRRLAREYGIPLVDAVQILEEHSPHGLLGDELFMDGQHPTLAGYLHLANAYAGILSERFDTPVRHPLRDEHEAAAALGFGARDLPAALVSAGGWLIATAVDHPFPHDRMALAEKRFRALLGRGDDFSAYVGIGLAQATARGLLRDADDVRALGGLIGYPKSYSVPSAEMLPLLARFAKFGVDEDVIEKLRTLDLPRDREG